MLWLKIIQETFLNQINSTKYCGRTAPVIDGISEDPQNAGLWSTKFKKPDNRCNPSTRNSLQEQLSSIMTEDDLETFIVENDILLYVQLKLENQMESP